MLLKRDLSPLTTTSKKPTDVLDNLVLQTCMSVTIFGVCPKHLRNVFLLKIMQIIKANNEIRNAIKHLWMFETIDCISMR